jgi:hypothetical protein
MPSFETSPENVPPELRRAAERLCARPVTAMERAQLGGNNRIYKVTTADADYAFKVYPDIADDPRDRLGVEFSALSFMSGQGLGNVPGPVGRDPEANLGLFEWIEGEAIEAPSDEDIDASVDFVAALHRLSGLAEARELPVASEACLSVAETINQVARRLEQLLDVADGHPALADFLARDFRPAFEAWRDSAWKDITVRGLDPTTALARAHWTLSPSDFGFHNSLRSPSGQIVFIDFEYFGWDDPVKLTSDFILHPGMSLSEGQRRRFVAGTTAVYSGDKTFSYRLALLYALFGYRWCMIILNEFLPERWRRRTFATNQGRTVAQQRQLEKARRLLDRIEEAGGLFPYD